MIFMQDNTPSHASKYPTAILNDSLIKTVNCLIPELIYSMRLNKLISECSAKVYIEGAL